MAKEQFTGLFAHDGVLEWTTIERGREGFITAGAGFIALAEETTPAPGEGETKPPADRATAEYAPATAHGIKSRKIGIKGSVSVGIPSERLLLRVINLPSVDDAELKSMVALQADKFSPFPVETMIVSHEVLARKDDGACLVLLGAVRNDVVGPLGTFLEEAGILPVRVDAAVLGWWQSLKDAGEVATDGARIVLVIGDTTVEIIVFAAGAPIMFRSISVAASESKEQFAGEIAYEVGYTLMSVELERGGESGISICVWQKEGESSLVADRLREECSCRVDIKTFPSETMASDGLARRLAEYGRQGLDLTPDAWRQREKSSLFKRRMAAIAGILIGIWALGAGGVWGGLYWEKIRISSLKSAEDEWRKPAMEVRAMRGRVFLIEKYRDRTRSALECLREISGAQPPGVELTSFAYRKGESVKLTGEADAAGHVLAFIDALNGSGLFSEIKPGAQSHNPGSRKQVFEIEAKLPGGEE